MSKILAVLPLSFTMMLGPQIISAVILVTSKKPIKNSFSFVAAIALAVSSGTFISFLIAMLIGVKSQSSNNQIAEIIKYIFVLLLIFLTIKTFLNRRHIKKPKWMLKLQNANTKMAFKLGLMLIFFMPSDIIIMLTVGKYLADNNLQFISTFPFILLTILVASIPIIFYLLFKKLAENKIPKIRDWMDVNSWLINIVVYIFFIFIFLRGG